MTFNAILTNTITNSLHALFLFIYFFLALLRYLKGDPCFSRPAVLLFGVLFVVKILGAYAHYFPNNTTLSPAWLAITLLIIMANYLLIEMLRFPELTRILIMGVSLSFSFLYIRNYTNTMGFLFIVSPLIFGNLISAYYSKGLLRFAFLAMILSSVLWIGVREIENSILGHPIDFAYRYDNDVYHFLCKRQTNPIYTRPVN